MAQKRYKVSATAQSGFYVVGTQLQVKLTYCRESGGMQVIKPSKLAGVVTIPNVATDVIGTVDELTQRSLDNFECPEGLSATSADAPTGMMFDDVTGTTVPGDVTVDLDALLT